MLKIKMIDQKEELEQTEPFFITNALWETVDFPNTYGYLAFVKEDGFYLKMVCEESNPTCTYTKINDPVYLDSAMEAFIRFSPETMDYVNFEVNANGAIRCRFDELLEEADIRRMECIAWMDVDKWSFLLHIPLDFLDKIYGRLCLGKGSRIYCNFYKVCQGSKPEQYGAYAYIESEIPALHSPEFFAEAVLV